MALDVLSMIYVLEKHGGFLASYVYWRKVTCKNFPWKTRVVSKPVMIE